MSIAFVLCLYATVQYYYTYVAVPGRNQTLSRCIFQAHCLVRSAAIQSFH